MDDTLKTHIDFILDKRANYIEMLCAAFIKEVGSEEASKYRLVEERSLDGLKMFWYFVRNPVE